VHDALISPNAIAGHADAASPAFVCSCTDDDLDAAWVHVAGELDRSPLEPSVHALQRSLVSSSLLRTG
jgi:hypothetical protein